jgi:hypothetical protein
MLKPSWPANSLPHLREVSRILATGVLRLRAQPVTHVDAGHTGASDQGESSLHFRADQSVHANRTNRRPACPA